MEIGETHVEALNMQSQLTANLKIGKYDEASNTVKKAKKEEAVCYMEIGGVYCELPPAVADKVTANYYSKREAVKRQYHIVVSPYDVKFVDSGIEAEIVKTLDYGSEKFAVVKVGDKEIVVADPVKESGAVKISIEYENVGVIDAKNDVRLV